MHRIRHRAQALGRVLLVVFAANLVAPVAHAGLVGTTQALGSTTAVAPVDRTVLAGRLVELGVDPAVVDARIAVLSEAEVAHLSAELDRLPAGGGVVGAAVFVFLVLLITDIAGYTDIFPFVKK